MSHLGHKCLHCKQAFIPTKSDQKFCRPACRQAAYRKRLTKRRKVRKELDSRPLIAATCHHCDGLFLAKRERAMFCSNSCRSLYHRVLKAAIPQALETAYGIPLEKALDIVETQPLWQVRGLLRDRGFSYRHEIREWVKI